MEKTFMKLVSAIAMAFAFVMSSTYANAQVIRPQINGVGSISSGASAAGGSGVPSLGASVGLPSAALGGLGMATAVGLSAAALVGVAIAASTMDKNSSGSH